MKIEPRDGALTTVFWNAHSWVGLSGDFGEVRLGRQFVPAFQIAIGSDPWAFDYNVGGASNFTRGGNGVTMSNNAVTYRTPKLAGLTAEFMVAAGQGGAAAVNAPTGRVGRNEGANVQYSAGPWWVGLGYNNSRQEGSLSGTSMQTSASRTTSASCARSFRIRSATTTSPAIRTRAPT